MLDRASRTGLQEGPGDGKQLAVGAEGSVVVGEKEGRAVKRRVKIGVREVVLEGLLVRQKGKRQGQREEGLGLEGKRHQH